MIIGVWVSSLESHVFRELQKNIHRVAASKGYSVITFIGAQLKDGPINTNMNQCYHLSQKNIVDGIISWTSIIASYCTRDAATHIIGNITTLPIVSIGMDIPGAFNLFPDDYKGAYESVLHLIKDHGYTKIACLKGSAHKESARQRLHGYIDALRDCGIPYRDEFVIEQMRPDQKSVSATLDAMGDMIHEIQAIVVFNDTTAKSLLIQLGERGFKVPIDIAVVGFDNVPESQYFVPSLTTVAIPLEDMAREAVERLEAAVLSTNRENSPLAPSRLIIRNSCGCGIDTHYHQQTDETLNTNNKNNLSSLFQKAKHLNIFAQLTEKELKDILKAMTDTILTALQGNITDSEPVQLFRNIIIQLTTANHKSFDWQKCINLLRTYILSGQMGMAALRKAEEFFNLVSEIAAEHIDNVHFEHNFTAAKKNEILSALGYELLSNNTLPGALSSISGSCASLHISHMHISIIEKKSDDTYSHNALSVLQFIHNTQPVIAESFDKPLDTFPSPDILPCNIKDLFVSKGYIVFPLVTETALMGFVSLVIDPEYIDILPRLQHLLSTNFGELRFAEEHSKVKEELQQTKIEARKIARESKEMYNLSIKDELTGMYNRRGFMVKFYDMKNDPVQTDSLTLFFLDMDNLKPINDTYGHEDGDIAIKACGEILATVFRRSDIIARMGGDEFAVIARGINQNKISELNIRIKEITEEVNKKLSKPYTVSFSSGFSLIDPRETKSIEQILSEADAMLYQEKRAKKVGRL